MCMFISHYILLVTDKGPRQLAQLLLTLEVGGLIIGRSLVDIRVCASTGRGRDDDEQKLSLLMAVML